MIREKRRAGLAAAAVLAWVVAGILMAAAVVLGCDTPVYEYTIQNWQRDPYQVRYFHDGGEDAADRGVNEYLTRIAKGTEGHANLSFAAVDVSSLDASAPYGHQQTWARHSSQALPFHVVTAPRGADLFVGRLDMRTSGMMVQSPKRTALAEQLSEGKQGVLLTLLRRNSDENAAARGAVDEVVTRSKEQNRDVGLVEVTRDDPKERWFMRQLLEVEDDLKDLANTMVFGVFGRGYVLPPYLGKGITVKNLAELVEFINGPCACEIKESNLGMDLLTDWNWQGCLANWSTSGAATPGFVLFDIQEEPNPQPVIQMPVLTSTETVSDWEPTPATIAKTRQEHKEQQPQKERAEKPDGMAAEAESSTSAQDSADEQATMTPTESRPTQETEQQIKTDESGQPESEAAEATPQRATESARAREETSGPKLPVSQPPPKPTDDLEVDQGASLGSALGLRVGLMLGAAAILAVAGGLLLARRGRDN